MKKFLLRMLTPERTFWDAEAVSVTVVDNEGERQILAGHAPLVVALRPASVRIDDGEKTRVCASGEGFLTVEKDAVYLMCQTFEWPEEIRDDRVNRAIQEHTEGLSRDGEKRRDYHEMTLERARARLSVLALQQRKNN
ncbi:MAG: ATP synthase F1 subunit epsilon [Clostridia bacterium]|nr:ATP synthase F1 subunit epsilon [Clostridia bacterium]